MGNLEQSAGKASSSASGIETLSLEGRRAPAPTDQTFAASRARPSGQVAVPARLRPGPRTYALACVGTCLEPEIYDGATVVCDPDAQAQPGDFVAVWWKSGAQPWIKRLACALPPRQCWDMSGDAVAVLVLERLNPPAQVLAPLAGIEAVHKVIHRIAAAEVLA